MLIKSMICFQSFIFADESNKTSRQNSSFAVFRNLRFANGQEIRYIVFIKYKISIEINVLR